MAMTMSMTKQRILCNFLHLMKINGAKPHTPLHDAKLLEDPSDNIIKVYLQALEWETQQRKFNMTASELSKLQTMSIDLLEKFEANVFKRKRQDKWLEI